MVFKELLHASFGFTELSASDAVSLMFGRDSAKTPELLDFKLLNKNLPIIKPRARDSIEQPMAIPAAVPPLTEPPVLVADAEVESAEDLNASRAIKISSLDAKH